MSNKNKHLFVEKQNKKRIIIKYQTQYSYQNVIYYDMIYPLISNVEKVISLSFSLEYLRFTLKIKKNNSNNHKKYHLQILQSLHSTFLFWAQFYKYLLQNYNIRTIIIYKKQRKHTVSKQTKVWIVRWH